MGQLASVFESVPLNSGQATVQNVHSLQIRKKHEEMVKNEGNVVGFGDFDSQDVFMAFSLLMSAFDRNVDAVVVGKSSVNDIAGVDVDNSELATDGIGCL